MEIALFIVQLGVVVAAVWYTLETRKLRLQNLQEIRLLAKQGQLTLAPFLVPGAAKLSVEQLHQLIDADNDLNQEEKATKKEAAEQEDVFFAVQVDNPTSEKVGCHLEPYIYDPSTKSFLIPDHGREVISPKDSAIFQVTGPYVTKSKIEERLEKSFGNVVASLYGHLDTPDESGYVALFFQDIEGTIYLSKREFKLVDGEVKNRPTKLFSATLS